MIREIKSSRLSNDEAGRLSLLGTDAIRSLRRRSSGYGFGLLLALGALVFTGCGCSGDPGEEEVPDPPECRTDAECIEKNDDRWYCHQGECKRGERYCEEEGDVQCCPGQECSHEVCLDAYETCTEDSDCRVAGQRCLERRVNRNDQTVCTFAPCEGGECPDGLHCFAGFCVGENPCRGGCSAGHACVLTNNQCHPTPWCEETCPPGSIITMEDHDNVDDDCDLNSLGCMCEPLPPLQPRDIGRHSGLARLPDGTLAVSAYNGDYGDLVVVYFDAEGNRLGTDWVDGVPTGVTPVANPTGARSGIDQPGENVGQYSSIAASPDGTLHVSYFDVEESRLKYARGSADVWTTMVVDEDGDVGRYSSIAVDDLGVPVIAYFRRRGLEEERFVTALKVAKADTPVPSDTSDWSVVTAESAAITPPPCDGGCPSGEHCVDDGENIDCYPSASGCDDCKDGERCVDLGDEGDPVCMPRVSTVVLEDLPDGTGLFPTVAVTSGGTIAVVYYDRTTGSLKLAENEDPSEEEPFAVHLLDGVGDGDDGDDGDGDGDADGADAGEDEEEHEVYDVGRYPSAVIDSRGDVAVVYQDANRSQLRWLVTTISGEVLANGMVDDGLRDPAGDGPSRVGVDNALIVTSRGTWLVAHQNATAGELVLSTREGGAWTHEVLAGEGAAGFWNSIVDGAGHAYISHAVIRGESSRPVTTKLKLEAVRH